MDDRKLELLVDDMLTKLQLESGSSQKRSLVEYAIFLLGGLKKQRIIGEKTAEDIIGKQFYDSLYPLKKLAFYGIDKILDLGSGGGLPGIPLKIYLPQIEFALLDSNKRKINFLKRAAEKMGLEKVEMLWGRAEELGQDRNHREQYDIVLSKAVAEMPILAELALPLTKVGGYALFYKGPRGRQEADRAYKAISECGARINKIWNYRLPTGEERMLFCISKINKTPVRYPRATGRPAKYPIK